jgi:hypothetical protein
MANLTIYDVKEQRIKNDDVRQQMKSNSVHQAMELRRARWIEKLGRKKAPTRLSHSEFESNNNISLLPKKQATTMAMHYNPTKPFNINDVEIREDANGRTFLAFPDGTRFGGVANAPSEPNKPNTRARPPQKEHRRKERPEVKRKTLRTHNRRGTGHTNIVIANRRSNYFLTYLLPLPLLFAVDCTFCPYVHYKVIVHMTLFV